MLATVRASYCHPTSTTEQNGKVCVSTVSLLHDQSVVLICGGRILHWVWRLLPWAGFISSPTRPDWLWGWPSLLFNGCWQLFPQRQSCMSTAICLHLHTLHCIYCRCNVWCPTWLSMIANMHINWERRSMKLYTYRNSYDAVWAWVMLQHGITTNIIAATDTWPLKLVEAAQTLKKEIQQRK